MGAGIAVDWRGQCFTCSPWPPPAPIRAPRLLPRAHHPIFHVAAGAARRCFFAPPAHALPGWGCGHTPGGHRLGRYISEDVHREPSWRGSWGWRKPGPTKRLLGRSGGAPNRPSRHHIFLVGVLASALAPIRSTQLQSWQPGDVPPSPTSPSISAQGCGHHPGLHSIVPAAVRAAEAAASGAHPATWGPASSW